MAHHLKNITTTSRHLRKLPFITKAPIFSMIAQRNCNVASCWNDCGFLDWGGFGYSTSSVEANGLAAMRLEDGGDTHQEFLRRKNGGGIFHHLASIDPSSCIEVGAVIHSRAVLGADVHIGSGSIIGPGVVIGQSTKVGYNVALNNCTLGDFCIIHNGVCVGQDGFGFFIDEDGQMSKKPQNMYANIGNHVEIGANACIDRGSWRDTVIGDHTKIDNLVQIAHNVVIGKNCLLCGQVGIAGSATVGDYVTLGGRVAVRDHVSVVSWVRLAANSCVTKDIVEPGDYGGFPAVPIREWRRQVAKHSISSKEGKIPPDRYRAYAEK
ncbi:putative UDP-3-O-acylglucosamine N-acyltransferase 2, mitochondrial [Drosera capensis]